MASLYTECEGEPAAGTEHHLVFPLSKLLYALPLPPSLPRPQNELMQIYMNRKQYCFMYRMLCYSSQHQLYAEFNILAHTF